MKEETNYIVRAWIWFWYNDVTRLFVVLLGLHLLVSVPILGYMGLPGETIRTIAIAQYMLVFAWAMVDNDYTNLNRIGLSAYRKPLKKGNASARH